jgi:transcriptional regulator with XRE-family HTH domain
MSDKDEVERLMNVLRTAIRLLGLSNREIERRLGLTPSYLSRLFGGYIELKVEHVMAIARAIGLHPAELFELAYPRRPQPASEAYEAIRSMLRGMQPVEEPRPAAPAGQTLTPEEIDRRIQESVRKAFRELANGK